MESWRSVRPLFPLAVAVALIAGCSNSSPGQPAASAQAPVLIGATISSPYVSEPTGLGSCAIMCFDASDADTDKTVSWVQGPNVYELQAVTGASVTESQFLSIARQISANVGP
jgi:hypothetical protein